MREPPQAGQSSLGGLLWREKSTRGCSGLFQRVRATSERCSGVSLSARARPPLRPPRRPRATAVESFPSSGSGRGAAWPVVSWTIWKAH